MVSGKRQVVALLKEMQLATPVPQDKHEVRSGDEKVDPVQLT